MPEQLTDEDRIRRAVQSVRNYIRDRRELNRLLNGQFENTDEEIITAIFSALEDFNESPFLLAKWTLANHPRKGLLVMRAAADVVRSATLWHMREHMPSSDGATSADDHAKSSEYMAWVDRILNEYETKKVEYKTATNIAWALSGQSVPSEYSTLGYWSGVYW
jgi:hypothetical protein